MLCAGMSQSSSSLLPASFRRLAVSTLVPRGLPRSRRVIWLLARESLEEFALLVRCNRSPLESVGSLELAVVITSASGESSALLREQPLPDSG